MIINNTVRIIVDFVSWGGGHADLPDPKLTIYEDYVPIETIDLLPYKISSGKYQYDYVVPDGTRALTFQGSGTLEGEPIVGRIQQPRSWI